MIISPNKKIQKMKFLIRFIDRVGDASGLLATIAIWLLTFTVTYDVVLRFLGQPNLWASEVSIYLMVALAFLGVGSTQRADGHFRVTFVRDLCPGPVRTALDILALGASVLFGAAFTIGAWNLASFSMMLNLRTSTLLEVPMWVLQGLLVVGGFLFTVAALRDLIEVIQHGSAHRDASSPSEVV
jgi:TRAP-type C4-dicarboxylate transport system permease small subunit